MRLTEKYQELIAPVLEDAKTKEIIKELIDTSFSGDNESQMKAVQLLKGLAVSDEPEANAFMKKLDTFTSGMSSSKDESDTPPPLPVDPAVDRLKKEKERLSHEIDMVSDKMRKYREEETEQGDQKYKVLQIKADKLVAKEKDLIAKLKKLRQ